MDDHVDYTPAPLGGWLAGLVLVLVITLVPAIGLIEVTDRTSAAASVDLAIAAMALGLLVIAAVVIADGILTRANRGPVR